jgi:hypothetical protein
MELEHGHTCGQDKSAAAASRGFFRVDNRLQMFLAINALQIRVCRQHFGLMLGIERSKLWKRAQPTPGQILVAQAGFKRPRGSCRG